MIQLGPDDRLEDEAAKLGYLCEHAPGVPGTHDGYMIRHLADQWSKRQWFNALHILTELSRRAVVELRRDINR